MTAAIETLFNYFGVIGFVSIGAWVVAALLMVMFIFGRRRSSVCWLALVIALVGWGTSKVNSRFVNLIQIDFSAEIRAARQRATDETTDEVPRESDVSEEAEKAKRAEADEKEEAADDSTDSKPEDDDKSDSSKDAAETPEDAGGQEESQSGETGEESGPSKEPESNVADAKGDGTDAKDDGAQPSGDEAPYDYRQRGTVERTEGMTVEEKIPIGPGTQDQPVVQNVRLMKSNEVAQANSLDRLNLFFARWTLYIGIFLVVFDYFRRLNMTFKNLLPLFALPLGGRVVDSLFAKTHSVLLHGQPKKLLKKYLGRAVRKGETFIYFGHEDPWTVPRLKKLVLFWPLDKITRTPDNEDFDDEVLFESAWFGRYCFVIAGDGPWALAKIDRLGDFLELRHATRATARHTVNVVWELETAIPPECLERLTSLCRATNFKLIVAMAEPPGEQSTACFEELFVESS